MKKAIRFTATWCGPCRAYKPVWEAIMEKRSDWNFETYDVDSNSEISQKYGVSAIPCTILEVDDNIVEKHIGYNDPNKLNSLLDKW